MGLDRSELDRLLTEDEDNFVQDKFGYCFYCIEPGERVFIYNLYVRPEARRQGRARRYLQYLIDEIRNAGYKDEIEIEIAPFGESVPREALERLYRSLGLTIYKRATVS